MNNYIVEKLESVSNLTDTISNDIDTAKKALAGLLTDKDRNKISYDIGALLVALADIDSMTDRIKWDAEDAKRESLKKEDHNTTK